MFKKQIMLILLFLTNFNSLISLPSPRATELRNLKEKVETLQTLIQTLQNKNKSLKAKKDDATEKVNKLKKQINAAEARISQAQKQRSTAPTAGLNAQIENLIKERNQAIANLNDAQNEFINFRKQSERDNNNLRAELEHLNSELKKLRKKPTINVSNLEDQIDNLTKENIKLSKKIDDLSEENQRLNIKAEYYKNQLVTIITLVNFSTSKKIKKRSIYRKANLKQQIEKQIKSVVTDMENYKKHLLGLITISPVNILNTLNETVLQEYFFNYPRYYNILNQPEREKNISALAESFAEKFKTKKPIEKQTEEELRTQLKQYQEEHQQEKAKLEDIITKLRSREVEGPEAAKEIVEEVLDPYYGEPGILKSN